MIFAERKKASGESGNEVTTGIPGWGHADVSLRWISTKLENQRPKERQKSKLDRGADALSGFATGRRTTKDTKEIQDGPI
jgi:hypothetical protein